MQEITHRRIWAISWPIILSNATVPLLGAFDTAVVGQLGDARLIGAVGLGAVILSSLYWLFGFLRMGTSGLAAQARGAGDEAELAAILYRALLIGGGAGLVLVLGQWLLIPLALMLSPASPEVEAAARSYLSVRIWGAPATIGLYAINGWLIACERTRAVLVLQFWINAVNAVLDLWFVLGLGFGVAGVAGATVIAEWSGLALGLWLCRSAFGKIARQAMARIRDGSAIRRMGAVNGAIMLRSVLLQGAFTSFMFLSAGQSDLELAANQILLQFLAVTAQALDGFAFATEALIGQAIGAKRGRDLDRALRLSLQWGLWGAGLMALVFAVAGGVVIDLMTTAPDLRQITRDFLPWAVASPLLGVVGWIYDGVFVGATQARTMLLVVAIGVVAYLLALALCLPLFGNHGLWAALMAMNAVRGIAAWALWPKLRPQAIG